MAGEEDREGLPTGSPAQLWIQFVDNWVPFSQLSRILSSMATLAKNAYLWEAESERRRHSVQLRRLTALSSNLGAVSALMEGRTVQISEGDILSVVDEGMGADSVEQRQAPRADAPDESLFWGQVHYALRQIQQYMHAGVYRRDERNFDQDLESVLQDIRNHNTTKGSQHG